MHNVEDFSKFAVFFLPYSDPKIDVGNRYLRCSKNMIGDEEVEKQSHPK
jgi:hypothetical protein